MVRGYSFIWSDKHASKMSKLDRFLVSQGMLDLFPNLTEDDFHSVIEDSWNNDGISASNSMILLKNKLKILKQRLKEWSSIKRRNKDHDRIVIQDSLIDIDLRLDKGNGLPDDLTKRANLFCDLKDIDHKDSIYFAQKAKIKWAVEGDENSKKFTAFLVIGDIVSQEQSAFIKGRQIMDGPLILDEVISWRKARKEQLIMFKVDFQKAFDSVRSHHKSAKKSNKVAHEMNDSNLKFPPGFTPQHSNHYEYEKVEALRESTTPQDSKKVMNDQTFHQVLEESVNKSSGVSKTTHADSMASPVKQRNRFSILKRFQEFIDIGQAMGYKMKGLFNFATSLARGRSGDSWNNYGISASNSMILLKNKLKILKQRLKEWSSIKRRNKDHDRKVIQDSLIDIDLRLDKRNGLPDDLTKRANLFRDLKDIDHKDSIDFAQKAKIKWAVEGDENSKKFHGIVNKKRRHLAIKGILVDGEWIENLNRVKSEFYSYYSNLFSAPAWDRSLFD
nr:RNA-directed DNA polymerase, eukaryota [Tanacetum cinerariifolium]